MTDAERTATDIRATIAAWSLEGLTMRQMQEAIGLPAPSRGTDPLLYLVVGMVTMTTGDN